MPQSHTYHDSVEEDSDSMMTVSNFSDAAPTELYADILTHWHGEDDTATEIKSQSNNTASDSDATECQSEGPYSTLEREDSHNGSFKDEGRHLNSDGNRKTLKEMDDNSLKSTSGYHSGQTNADGKSDNGPPKTEKQYLETDIDSCVLDNKDFRNGDQGRLNRYRLDHSSKCGSENSTRTKAEIKSNSSSKDFSTDTSNDKDYASQVVVSCANFNQNLPEPLLEQQVDAVSLKTDNGGSKIEDELHDSLKSELRSEKEAIKEQKDQSVAKNEAKHDQKEAVKEKDNQKDGKKDQKESIREKQNQKDLKEAQKYQKDAQKDPKDVRESQKVDKEPTLKEEIVKVNCTKFFFKLGLVDSESSESINTETHDDKHVSGDSGKLENASLGTIHTSSYITSL